MTARRLLPWLVLAVVVALPHPAAADNCGNMTDCYGTVAAGLAIAGALALGVGFVLVAVELGAAMAGA
ncbi:MAG: hypothetical protein WBQ64_21200, partial [Terriglobales bacterium]